MNKNAILRFLALGFLTINLSSCGFVEPTPTTIQEIDARAKQDYNDLFNGVQEVYGPISLYQAMARGIKYNLDHRLKLFESVASRSNLDVVQYDMLPEIVAEAGYFNRNNFHASSSQDIIDGSESLQPSTSQERDHFTAELRFSWNILDFGISYISAKQAADEYLISVERRRKMVQNIMRDIRHAYYRTISAQNLSEKIDPLIDEIKKTLASTSAIQKEGLRSPREVLEFERSLWEILRQLNLLQRDIQESKIELSTLMGMDPGSIYSLVEPDYYESPLPASFTSDLDVLEQAALRLRPELLEEDYRSRITERDIDKARLEMLPAPILEFSQHYDSNKFLVHQDWRSFTARAVWNLVNLISGPSKIDFEKNRLEVDRLRRLALTVAVLTQVDVSYIRYNSSKERLDINKSLLKTDKDLLQQVKQEFDADKADELEVIRSKANLLLSELRHDIAYADLQNAAGQLIASVGVDPLPNINTTKTVEDITNDITEYYNTNSYANLDHFRNNVLKKEVYVEPKPYVPAYKDDIVDYKNLKATKAHLPKKVKNNIRIQFGSLKTQHLAQKKMNSLKSNHSPLFNGVDTEIVYTNIKNKGHYFRLQALGFKNKKQAHKQCKSFIRNGIDCFVVR